MILIIVADNAQGWQDCKECDHVDICRVRCNKVNKWDKGDFCRPIQDHPMMAPLDYCCCFMLFFTYIHNISSMFPNKEQEFLSPHFL